MILPRQILVPTDLGPMSDAALDYAVELARPFGATVHLVHVFEPPALDLPEGMIAGLGDATGRVLSRAEETLASSIESRRDTGVPIESSIREGRAWKEIIAAANELEDGVIVMATHHRKGLARMLLGSVAEKVVRMAPCPVLTLPEPTERTEEPSS